MASARMAEFQYLTAVYDYLNGISPTLWTEFKYFDENTGKMDVLGHYGAREKAVPPAAVKLALTFYKYNKNISDINDGFDASFAQTTPKARILAAIDAIRIVLYPDYFI